MATRATALLPPAWISRGRMPPVADTLFGMDVGAIIWAGLYLRDARVRALLV